MTQHQQAMAATRAEWGHRRRRRAIAYVTYAVAAVIAVGHFLEHAGTISVMSPGVQDLLIGWPMRADLALVGAIVCGT